MTRSGFKARDRGFLWQNILIVLAVVFSLLPLVWTLLASIGIWVNNNTTPPSWHGSPSFEPFAGAVLAKSGFITSILNSFGIAALTALIATFTASLAAYALARARFSGQNLLVHVLLVLSGLPVIAYMMPLKSTLLALHLGDTFLGTALSESALFAPLATFVVFGYFKTVPLEPEQAAQLEGANPFQVLRHVVFPSSSLGIFATALVIFVLSWNQFLLPSAVTFQLKTVPVIINDFFTFEREPDWQTAAAALMAAFIPVMLVVASLFRLLERFNLGETRAD